MSSGSDEGADAPVDEALVKAAVTMLLTTAFAGAEGAIPYKQLGKKAGASRSTVNRHLGPSAAGVAKVAEWIFAMEQSNVRQILDILMEAYLQSPNRGRDLLEMLLG